jgi:hypothetical protein
VLFCGIICAGRVVWQDRSLTPSPQTLTYIGILTALLAVALHSTFDFPQQVGSLQLYVAVYLGIAWANVSPRISPNLDIEEPADQNASFVETELA